MVEDMDSLMFQYGNMQQQTGAARSRFLAPIYNNLVAQFGGSIRNMPGSLVTGPVKKPGRFETHFEVFGAMAAIVLVEAKLELGTTSEHMDLIAQVIAECSACDFVNMQAGVHIPIYGIFCDGTRFQFFSFDGSVEPYTFSIGLIPGTHFRVGEGYALDEFAAKPTACSFIDSLRPICEIMFNLFLRAFVASLKSYRDTFAQENLDGWEKAIKLADEVLEKSLNAEALRQKDLIDDADAATEAAFRALKLSTAAVPIADRYTEPAIMDGWNYDAVRKA